jgi:hypothetical protein
MYSKCFGSRKKSVLLVVTTSMRMDRISVSKTAVLEEKVAIGVEARQCRSIAAAGAAGPPASSAS